MEYKDKESTINEIKNVYLMVESLKLRLMEEKHSFINEMKEKGWIEVYHPGDDEGYDYYHYLIHPNHLNKIPLLRTYIHPEDMGINEDEYWYMGDKDTSIFSKTNYFDLRYGQYIHD